MMKGMPEKIQGNTKIMKEYLIPDVETEEKRNSKGFRIRKKKKFKEISLISEIKKLHLGK